MRKLTLYLRMAFNGLCKNHTWVLPHLLTCAGCTGMFYILRYLVLSDMVHSMQGAEYIQVMLALGTVILALVNAFVIFYANNFVMRRRERELGLLNILGMEKRQVAHVEILETLMLYGASLLIGLAAGVLFSKLALLLLSVLMRDAVPMGFSVDPRAMLDSAIMLSAVFLLMLIRNLWVLLRSQPVEMIHAARVGEREPRSRRVQAAIGVICLFAGYAIAVTIQNPLAALLWFFVAVILVMIGTWCLFTAISVVVLKALRRNRRFYYQPRHFTAVSGMLYRMKQNAKGLTSICLLATMLLVTISTTACMYAGSENALLREYPNELSLQLDLDSHAYIDADTTALAAAIQSAADASGCTDTALSMSEQLSFAAAWNGEGFTLNRAQSGAAAKVYTLLFLPAEDYARLSGRQIALKANEVIRCGADDTDRAQNTVKIAALSFSVKEDVAELPIETNVYMTSLQAGARLYVVADRATMNVLDELQRDAYGNNANPVTLNVSANPAGTDAQKDACLEAMRTAAMAAIDADADSPFAGSYSSASRSQRRVEYYAMYGSFLFLGIFLGLMFLLATVLMIYYKQLSEGYEDRERFIIMQQVGMSAQEVRASIRSQVLMIFFLPLIVAAIHVAFAFPMIRKLLLLFNLDNLGLFLLCTLTTLAVFSLVYVAVYAATARKYYKIVRA